MDKATLKGFKIGEAGLLDCCQGYRDPNAGLWATNALNETNTTRAVTIPGDLAPGNYVLREERFAFRDPYHAQHYPQCVNLQITGADGVLGTDLYRIDDPSLTLNIPSKPPSYHIPGPSLVAGGQEGVPPGWKYEGKGKTNDSTRASSRTAAVKVDAS